MIDPKHVGCDIADCSPADGFCLPLEAAAPDDSSQNICPIVADAGLATASQVEKDLLPGEHAAALSPPDLDPQTLADAKLSPQVQASIDVTTALARELTGCADGGAPTDHRAVVIAGIVGQVGGFLMHRCVETGFTREELLSEVLSLAKDLVKRAHDASRHGAT